METDGCLDLMLVMDLKATDSETLVRISNHLGEVVADIERELELRQFVWKGHHRPPAKPAT
jgi:hypothetical protein